MDLTNNNLETYNIDNYNLLNMTFIKSKNNYKIFIKNFKQHNKLRIRTPSMFTPFGMEKYNSKDIVNLEFIDYNKNNEMYNFLSTIRQVDKFFINLKYDNFVSKLTNDKTKEIVSVLKNKSYISCIRPRGENFNPLLRTHVKKTKKTIQTVFYKGDDIINPTDIQFKMANFTIELGFLWVTDTSYGVVWYLNGGKLVN
jgi:hypothetical protein